MGHLNMTEITDKLFAEKPAEQRCPFIRKDESSPYCAKEMTGTEVSESRRMVCDTFSLQLWCLESSTCNQCIFYNGARVSQ